MGLASWGSIAETDTGFEGGHGCQHRGFAKMAAYDLQPYGGPGRGQPCANGASRIACHVDAVGETHPTNLGLTVDLTFLPEPRRLSGVRGTQYNVGGHNVGGYRVAGY